MNLRSILNCLILGIVLSVGSNLYGLEKLPENLQWETNETAPTWASPNAKKGGTYHYFILSFPLTFRTVGPDANGPFRPYILNNNMTLVNLHPNTEEILPGLATHWAYGSDGKTMYFKLDKRAKWSDGQPLTADDFVYKLKFMRSKYIVAPWYNNHYTKEIDQIIKYDDHTLAVVLTRVKPDLWYHTNETPIPKHFYGELTKDFVKQFNWKIAPNTGPYQISKFKKGKSVTLKRDKNWWAKDLRYFKGRYNVDKILLTVIREETAAFEYFKKQKLDIFPLTTPLYWHEKAKNMEVYEKGYVNKIWTYTDTRVSPFGLWLNQDKEIFKDPKVRYAFAHAMNVDKLIKVLMRNDFRRLQNFNTGFGEYSNPNIRARTFDLKQMETLMKAAGWKRGTDGIWSKGTMRFSVNLSYGADRHTPRLVLLQEEAKKAGVELKLQQLDASTWQRVVGEKKYDIIYLGWGTGFRPAYWEFYHSENAHKPQTNNITNTDNAEMDELIEVYRNSTESQKRIEYAHRIQEKLHELATFVPLYYADYTRTAYWRWWRFPEVPASKSYGPFVLFKLGLNAGTFWFDPELKKETEQAIKSGKTFPPQTIIDETFRAN